MSATRAVDDGLATGVQTWIAAYCEAVGAEPKPAANGWVSVPCPCRHPRVPDGAPKATFVVHVGSGLCRCHVCGAGGTINNLRMLLVRTVGDALDDVRAVPVSRIASEPHQPVAARKVAPLPGDYLCESIHWYRTAKGEAYAAAIVKPMMLAGGVQPEMAYAHRRGDEWWWGLDAAEDRQLYRREALDAARDGAIVVVTSDEESADCVQIAAERAAPDGAAPGLLATTWLGGAGAWRRTRDWAPLYGCDVVLWPDNDHAARTAMYDIAHQLDGRTRNTWWVDAPGSDMPVGGNAATCAARRADPLEFVAQRAVALSVRPDLDGEREDAADAA